MKRGIALSVLLAGLAGFASPAPGAIFCVTDSAQLQEALDLAESNGEDDTVRVAAGLYPAPDALFGFVYNPGGGDDLAIAITGGWSAGDSCASQSPDPSLSVLDGGGTGGVMRIFLPPTGNLSLRYLTFANGSLPEHQRGGGLRIPNVPGYAGSIRIENNRFVGNTADYGGGLALGVDASADARVFVTNNLLAFNHARQINDALELSIGEGDAYVTNNTILSNTSDHPLSRAVDIFGAGHFVIANNSIWGNQGRDLMLRTTDVYLLNNNIEVRLGEVPDIDAGNISVSPVYDIGVGPYAFTPSRNSPLVNAGLTSSEPWYFTEFDLKGAPRVVGSAVDIGAYENTYEIDLIFHGGFEQP